VHTGLRAGFALIAACAAFGASLAAPAGPQIKPGVYRVDVNGKLRELCVDEIGNGELSAAGWKDRLGDQGVRCSLHDRKQTRDSASWTGRCSAPGMGKVFNTEHRVTVKLNADGSFDLLTVLSGDLQARIPVRGERVAGATCDSQQDVFRPWQ